MNDATYVGGCRCGRIRYSATGPAENLCFCHCESCRRSAGAPMVAWGTFALDRFIVTQGALTEHASSRRVKRGFCEICGTSLTYFHEGRPGEIDVTLVTLDDPSMLVPERHIWVRDKLPWVSIDDGRPQYPTFRSDG